MTKEKEIPNKPRQIPSIQPSKPIGVPERRSVPGPKNPPPAPPKKN